MRLLNAGNEIQVGESRKSQREKCIAIITKGEEQEPGEERNRHAQEFEAA